MKKIKKYLAAVVIAMMGVTFVPSSNVVYAEAKADWSFLTEAHNIVADEHKSSSLSISWDGPSGANVTNTVVYTNKTTGVTKEKSTSEDSIKLEGLDSETDYDIYIETKDDNKNTKGTSDTYTFKTYIPDFLVLTADSLYGQGEDSFTEALTLYLKDLEAEGLNPGVFRISNTKEAAGIKKCDTKEKLKALIKTQYNKGCKGFVIVGSAPDIPTAYWRYAIGESNEDIPEGDFYPCDLYYADMNQEWTDLNGDGVFESYNSVTESQNNNKHIVYKPELYYGRINPNGYVSGTENVKREIVSYFNKLDAYRQGEKLLSDEEANRALVFKDCEDFRTNKSPVDSICKVFKDVKGVYNETETSPENMKAEFERGYGVMYATMHSAPYLHQMHVNVNGLDQSVLFCLNRDCVEESRKYAGEPADIYVEDIRPRGYYLIMDGCSTCRFENVLKQPIKNIGAHYLFNSYTMLNVAGYTGPWGLHFDSNYYNNLFGGDTVGEAFFKYLKNETDEGTCKATLLGDPTVNYGKKYKVQENSTPYITKNLAGDYVNGKFQDTKTVRIGVSNTIGETNVSGNVYYNIDGLSPDKYYVRNKRLYVVPTQGDMHKKYTLTVYTKDDNGQVKSKYTENFVLTADFNGTKYEAEDSKNTGIVQVDDHDFCSGGKEATYIGGDYSPLTFNQVYAAEAGEYVLKVDYVSGEAREGYIQVNNNTSSRQKTVFEKGAWDKVSSKYFSIYLNQGYNTITLGNDSRSCTVNTDCIEIVKAN